MTSEQILPRKAGEFLVSLIGRSPATKKLYRTVLSHLFEFTEKKPNALELFDLQRFLQHLEEEHAYKRNTLRVYVNILRNFLGYLKREDLREQITAIKPSKTLPIVPKPKEIEKMINVASTLRNKMILQILVRTGIRVGELCNLDIGGIDLPNLRIIIRGQEEWKPKGGKERVVRMNAETASLIKEYIGSRKEGRLLNITPGTIRTMLKRVAKRAGVRNVDKISPHKLRHFFACDFLQRGGDVRSLQKLLGHEELSTTEIYLNYDFDIVSQVYNKAFRDKHARENFEENGS